MNVRMKCQSILLWVIWSGELDVLSAFVPCVGLCPLARCSIIPLSESTTTTSSDTDGGWSVADDWNRNSQYENESMDQESLWLVSDRLDRAARNMQRNSNRNNNNTTMLSPEDLWLRVMLDQIATDDDDSDDCNVKDNKLDPSPLDEEIMDQEIAMLIRCNQDPHNFLIAQGRAIPELTDSERYDLKHLLHANLQPTDFFRNAVSAMFQEHCKSQRINGDDTTHSVLDGSGVAAWMEKCWNEPVGLHDPRVTRTLARYGRAGYLTKDDFIRMYVSALTGSGEETDGSSQKSNLTTLAKRQSEVIQTVWQDLYRHGIISPAEVERNEKLAEIQQNNPDFMVPNMLDECALLDDESPNEEGNQFTDRHGKSSFERVELIPAKNAPKTPVWMRDGQFVFIDEASCIGCGQCVTTAPASFQMLDFNGRARTFMQRNSPDVKAAVAACPVDCMKYVSFDELEELELSRDNGVNDDHRHFGHTKTRGYIPTTPLHVARRDSDANHKSSFYHFLRNKCMESTQCPQRGCFDCPKYKPGANPFFQERLQKATHARAEFFIKTGIADSIRKTEEL